MSRKSTTSEMTCVRMTASDLPSKENWKVELIRP
jgi:hypothetical protein